LVSDEFKIEYTLNGIGVRPATVEEASVLFPGYWAGLLTVWAEQDKLLITADGDLFVSDATGLNRAQATLTEYTFAWEDLLEVVSEHSMQAESYNIAVAVGLLAAGWRPSATKD
jgi:hypothetical protein